MSPQQAVLWALVVLQLVGSGFGAARIGQSRGDWTPGYIFGNFILAAVLAWIAVTVR